jgi:hypothetical protein
MQSLELLGVTNDAHTDKCEQSGTSCMDTTSEGSKEVQQETVTTVKGCTRLTDNLTALRKNSLLLISDHYKTKIFYISYRIPKRLNPALFLSVTNFSEKPATSIFLCTN